MIVTGFVVVALVIVFGGIRLARYGDVLAEKSGLGRNWIGLVLVAATTSLPELVTGVGATAVSNVPDIAVGDVLGSCMFNLLILSLMDAVQPDPAPLSTRAQQGHALSIGFGMLMVGLVGMGLVGRAHAPALGGIGLTSFGLAALYFVAMRTVYEHAQRRARQAHEVAEELRYEAITMRTAATQYAVAAAFVVAAALALPRLGAELARQTALGEAFVGSLFVAITTSLPEIVVSLAAVRMGAIDLGIGNVLGSNLFNLLILALDDVWFRQGSLLAVVDPSHGVFVAAVVMMNALFLVGLTHQALHKRFVVAWDTGAMAVVYAVAVALSFVMRG